MVLVGVGALAGGGGSERYFADLVAAAAAAGTAPFELHLLADADSVAALARAGRNLPDDKLRLLPTARWQQARALHGLASRYALLHLVQALPRHLPWLWALRSLPRAARPCITLNLNDARVAPAMAGTCPPALRPGVLEYLSYDAYFRTAPIAGVMSWYRAFVDVFPLRYRSRPGPLLHAARYCCVDTEVFAPAVEKRPWVVYAGRLVEYKRPLLFIAGIARACALAPALIAPWHFHVFGDGVQAGAVRAAIAAHGLEAKVSLGESAALRDTLSQSRLFVSTQDLENFTSLAMLEAMASGNAVIARELGQTRDFVRPGENGLLARGHDAEAIGLALVEYLRQPERHAAWQAESRRITLEEHCRRNVMEEFEQFWAAVLAARAARA